MKCSETKKKHRGVDPDFTPLPEASRYTVLQAAEKLGVCRTLVYNAFKSGRLRAINPLSRPVRFYGKDLNKFWRAVTG